MQCIYLSFCNVAKNNCQFLAAAPALPNNELIVAVRIPVRAAGSKHQFVSYRSALRKTQAHAYVNAAFEVELSDDGSTIKGARVAFGAIGEHDKPGETAKRAREIEKALIGATVGDAKAAQAAIAAARASVVPVAAAGDVESELAYRRRLVVGFVFKFLAAIAGDKVPDRIRSAASDDEPRLTRGKQIVLKDGEDAPVHQAIRKIEGLRQATG